MSRPIRAILLLIMLFISASGIPLYADTPTLSFDFSLPFKPSTDEIIAVDSSITMVSSSDPELQLSLTGDTTIFPLEFNQEKPVELSLYFQDRLITTIDTPEITISHGMPTVIHMKLPQNLFDVPNGNYELAVKLHIDNIKNPTLSSRVAITYDTETTYLPALNAIDRNETALTLYFPDNNINHLIPITRVIPFTRTPLRSTIDNLEKGPRESLGLPTGSPIPTVQRLNLSRGIANVYLPMDIGTYDTYATSARVAVESLLNSLTSIHEVQGIQFYFDNKILEAKFHGRVVSEPLYPSKNPMFYIGYLTDTSRILLVPMSMDLQQSSIEAIFEGLKYSSGTLPYEYRLLPTVPEDVALLGYSIEDKGLKLKFNDAFLKIYENSCNKISLMVDSIVYTFTSLEDIDYVELQVEVENSSAITGDSIFNKPLSPSPYINPEE
ncbi:GerMN domain-containing protein [Natronincola ferrireducens]|uniref:Sporulation and spore germination n=1 Tax=Natronincola ferrireducens TaxID=393762 RepID=A0A1G9HAK6_9FIRM|nr:GerMN domain-containing protein [Natronincola ferrireducens]SDL09937.1 Sporulation and spore germination [Natronincola ferrireducens]